MDSPKLTINTEETISASSKTEMTYVSVDQYNLLKQEMEGYKLAFASIFKEKTLLQLENKKLRDENESLKQEIQISKDKVNYSLRPTMGEACASESTSLFKNNEYLNMSREVKYSHSITLNNNKKTNPASGKFDEDGQNMEID